MRIAMVGLRGLPATYGGVEHHVEQLGARMAQRGHQVTVFCRPNYTPEETTETRFYRGMRLVSVPTVATKHLEAFVHSGLSALKVLTPAERRNTDIVHFHALGPGLFTPVPRYLSPASVVQTVHGLDDQRDKWGGAASRALSLGRWMSANIPQATITVSQSLADLYLEQAGRQCVYVPNGAPEVQNRPADEIVERFGLRAGGYLLWVGRIVPEKAPHLLIEAFRKVSTDLRLVIVGGSSFTDDYSSRVQQLADADPRVLLTGYQYGNALQELYSNTALYVQPSLLEGMPLTLLEAAAYGRAVVASDIGPHAEVIGLSAPGRRLVPVGDVDALTTAITEALGDPSAAAQGAATLHTDVRKNYDWDDATERTLEVYASVLGRSRRSAALR